MFAKTTCVFQVAGLLESGGEQAVKNNLEWRYSRANIHKVRYCDNEFCLQAILPTSHQVTIYPCNSTANPCVFTRQNIFSFKLIGYVDNIPKMQFCTGISRNTQSKSYTLSLTEISEIMHCEILINIPYCF